MEGSRKRKLVVESWKEPESDTVVDKSDMDITTKVATAIACPSVVGVISHNLPAEMIDLGTSLSVERFLEDHQNIVFWGCGTIIECEQDAVTHKYLTTIIVAASLFERTNGVKPDKIMVDVYLSDSKLCHAKLLACDFHYNLAAIQIQTHSPLQAATLRAVDDVVSLHPESSFQLRPHSNLFKIFSGTKIISLGRALSPEFDLVVKSHVIGTSSLNTGLDCDELYWLKDERDKLYGLKDEWHKPYWLQDERDKLYGLKDERHKPYWLTNREICGVPVINCSGEVFGIMFYDSPFLPINIVSRWWKHYKSSGKCRRPWLGVKVTNLYSTCLGFLEDFMWKFPNINSGVVVTKVVENILDIHPKDVIVECDGKKVGSILQLFDIIWDKIGESVEVIVLRASPECKKFKSSLIVRETTPEKLYKWRRTFWMILHGHELPKQAQLTNI